RLTQRLSLSTQKRRRCRLGRKRRLVLLLACETWWPTMGPLPVIWQTRAMARSLALGCGWGGRARGRETDPGELPDRGKPMIITRFRPVRQTAQGHLRKGKAVGPRRPRSPGASVPGQEIQRD